MCGISGLANCGDRETLARMNHVQFHRGPDDNGIWERRFSDGSYIGLGSRRLAILDLSADGHMPMCNEDGSVWITYNGEIYNFRELRSELEAKGHCFVSDTDTEVVIHLYEEEGRDCVRRLSGMFAFAICDLRGAKPAVFVARDHFGIKPFYYAQRGNRFAFASELKALLQVPGIQAEIDVQALHQYLTFLWVPDPATMFRGVLKLPPGHYGVWQDGSFEITQYWDLTFADSDTTFGYSEAELADEVRARFERSVQAQMISDVPVGAFLSAGLDSSSIVAAMAKTTRQPVRTYTITFPKRYRRGENALDDPDVAARVARQLGCEHRTITVEPDVASLLGKLTWHMDEPIADPAIIAAYLVCREARDHATVMLSGVGGDELFGGYRKYYAHVWAEAYGRIPSTVRHWLESSLLRLPAFRGTAVKATFA
jgi:asparagine synthase (glutamine-hydrolysing)